MGRDGASSCILIPFCCRVSVARCVTPSHTLTFGLQLLKEARDHLGAYELFIDATADKLFPARRASRNRRRGIPLSVRRHRVPRRGQFLRDKVSWLPHSPHVADPSIVRGPRAVSLSTRFRSIVSRSGINKAG